MLLRKSGQPCVEQPISNKMFLLETSLVRDWRVWSFFTPSSLPSFHAFPSSHLPIKGAIHAIPTFHVWSSTCGVGLGHARYLPTLSPKPRSSKYRGHAVRQGVYKVIQADPHSHSLTLWRSPALAGRGAFSLTPSATSLWPELPALGPSRPGEFYAVVFISCVLFNKDWSQSVYHWRHL